MKPILFTLLISIGLPLVALAQQYSDFKLDTDKPETGKPIHFLYTGDFGRSVDSRLTMYFERNGLVKWQTLKAKYNGNGIEGTLTIPDSVLAICIKIKSTHDTLAATIFSVYKNGKRIPGSLMAAAKFYNAYNQYSGLRNPQQAASLVAEELQEHPQIKSRNLIGYYETVFWPLVKNDVLNQEMEQTWNDSLASGKSEQFLNRLYWQRSRSIDRTLGPKLKEQLVSKYPNGEIALSDAVILLQRRLRTEDITGELLALEAKYSTLVKAGKIDGVYRSLALKELENGNIAAGELYLPKIIDSQIKKEVYSSASSNLLKTNGDLIKAETYIQKAIELLKFEKPPYYVFDARDWEPALATMKANYIDGSAQIQYRLGNISEAIKRLKTILPIVDYNNKIREHYLQYLLESGNAKEALAAASQFVIMERSNDNITKLLKDAYVKDKGSDVGYGGYYSELLKKAVAEYKLRDYGLLNVKSIDFTLKATDGMPVTLSTYKGRPVVLYFFGMNYSTAARDAINACFSKLAKQDYGPNTPVFLAIDRTSVNEIDEANGMPLRMEKTNNFLKQKGLDFKVLMDVFFRHPTNTAYSYYRVSDVYSSGPGDNCQFYMIDPDGIVKYKSFPNSLTTAESFEREFLAAFKLVK